MDSPEDVRNANAQFWQRGGARFGGESRIAGINLTWPFVTLTADVDKLLLGGLFHIELPKNSLVRLSRYDGVLNKGLRIEYVVRGASAFIVFWTFNYNALAAALQRLGYVVDS